MDERELTKNRLCELCEVAERGGYFTFSEFLGLSEQAILKEILSERRRISVTLFGGAEGAERVIARFGDEAELGYSEPFPIRTIRIVPKSPKFAEKLTHPRHSIPKIYHVTVKGEITDGILRALNSPMTIDGYKLRPTKTKIHEKSEHSCVLEMTLFEGRNRQIRKMCDNVGLKITRLCRVALGDIQLGSLPEGKWRRLTKDELDYLDKSLQAAASKK